MPYYSRNANIIAANINMESENSTIGSIFNDLNIYSNYNNSGGTVTAIADSGNIFLVQVGVDPNNIENTDTIIVDTIQARDNIYLQADWQIQNYDGLIRVTGTNGSITIATDDTKLWNEAPIGLSNEYGGTIDAGTSGKVIFKRNTEGDIWIGYDGPGTEDYDNPNHASCFPISYVTDKEMTTINAGTVISVVSGNKIIDDNYNFRLYPIDAGDEDIYILRSTPGDFHIGNFDISLIDANGYIHQSEIYDSINNIALIKADNIYFGNVLNPAEWVFADTENIYLYSPDFSLNSASGRAANVTFAASGNIIDGNTSNETPLYAQDITFIADSDNNDSGNVGGIGTNEDIDIYTLNSGELNASAYGVINIQEPLIGTAYHKSLYLGLLESRNDSVYLSASSNVYDANGDGLNVSAYNDVNILAWYYYLYNTTWRQNGAFGTATDFMEIDSAISGTGTLTVGSYNTYIEEMSGDLNINTINGNGASTATNIYLKANDPSGADILDANLKRSSRANYNLAASTIWLEALYGSIGQGNMTDEAALDIYGHTVLSAYAGTSASHNESEVINIDHSALFSGTGDSLKIDRVMTNNLSTVNLFSLYSNIYDNDYNLDGAVDIAAGNINIYTPLKSIGAGFENNRGISARIEIELLDQANGLLNAAAFNSIYLASDADMRLDNIKLLSDSALGYIYLDALNGGSIINGKLAGDTSANIRTTNNKCSPSVRLTGYDIGSNTRALELYINTSARDVIEVNAINDVYLNNQIDFGLLQFYNSSSGGDFNVTSLNDIGLFGYTSNYAPAIIANGTLSLSTTQNIYDSQYVSLIRYSEYPLLRSNNIILNAGSSIGGNGDIEIDAVNASVPINFIAEAEEDILVTFNNSDLNSTRINSANGSAYIYVTNGSANIDYISAPVDVQVIALDGVFIDTIDPTNVVLKAEASGSTISVKNGLASNSINLQGDNINVNFSDTSATDPVYFNVSGSSSNRASNVTINLVSNSGAVFNTLNANEADISTTGATLNLLSASIGNTGLFTNNTHAILIDNTGTSTIAADLVLDTISGSTFVLDINDSNTIKTSATVLSNNSGLVVDQIINEINNSSWPYANSLIFINYDGSAGSIVRDISKSVANNLAEHDISQVDQSAEELEEHILKNPAYIKAEGNVSGEIQGITMNANPEIYLDKKYEHFTMAVLQKALVTYKQALADKKTEKDAINEAIKVLKQANFNYAISNELIKRDSVNKNTDLLKILKEFPMEISVINK